MSDIFTSISALKTAATIDPKSTQMSQSSLSDTNAPTAASSVLTTIPTQSSQSTTAPSSPSLPPPEGEQNSMRLPGMKRGIAVGVGVSVATIIILFVIYIAIKRRRALYKKNQQTREQPHQDVEKGDHAQLEHIKVESDARPIHEMDATTGPGGELPTLCVDTKEKEDRHHSVIHELPSPLPPDYQESERRSATVVHELPSPLPSRRPSPLPETGDSGHDAQRKRFSYETDIVEDARNGDQQTAAQETGSQTAWTSRARSNMDSFGQDEAREFDSAWARRVMRDAGMG